MKAHLLALYVFLLAVVDTPRTLLEDHGHEVNINVQNSSGSSSLMAASYGGQTEAAKVLLDHGAQVDLQDSLL